MAKNILPDECFIDIAKYLDQKDIYALACTRRKLFHVLERSLYYCNARYHKKTAFAFGVSRGLEDVAKKSLDAYAGDINAEIFYIIPGCDARRHSEFCHVMDRGTQQYNRRRFPIRHGNRTERPCRISATPLMWAARYNKVDLMGQLVQQLGANILARACSDYTALHHAAVLGHVESIEFLLNHGTNVNITARGINYRERHSVLWHAARRGRLAAVRLLVNRGADINLPGGLGCPAIRIALVEGHVDVASFLLEQGAELPTDSKFFFLCAESGFVPAVEAFLDRGFPVDEPTYCKQTALILAAENGNTDVARVLLNRGASIGGKRHVLSPIYAAVNNGHVDVLTLLIKHIPYFPDYQKRCRESSLQNGEEMAIAKLLVDWGIKPNALIHDQTLLLLATKAGKGDLVDLFLVAGANPAPYRNGLSLLFWAIKCLDVTLLRLILRKGGDPNAYSKAFANGPIAIEGFSEQGDFLPPLAYAMIRGEYDKARVLLDYGANPHCPHGGRNKYITMANATRSMDCDFIKKMLAHGLDINEVDDNGDSPISIAVEAGNSKVVELLLASGADPYKVTKATVPMLTLALEGGHVAVVDLLRKHGAIMSVDDDATDRMG